MINRNKMSNYARSMIFPEPNPQYGLNRRSVFNLIKFFRPISRSRYSLSSTSYPERRFSLGGRSYSWCENDRALDDLVTREIEPLSWKSDNDSYKKISLNMNIIHSYICSIIKK
jgi:hypothetical protein